MKTNVATVKSMSDRKVKLRLSDAHVLRQDPSAASMLQKKNSCFPHARQFTVVPAQSVYAFV